MPDYKLGGLKIGKHQTISDKVGLPSHNNSPLAELIIIGDHNGLPNWHLIVGHNLMSVEGFWY